MSDGPKRDGTTAYAIGNPPARPAAATGREWNGCARETSVSSPPRGLMIRASGTAMQQADAADQPQFLGYGSAIRNCNIAVCRYGIQK